MKRWTLAAAILAVPAPGRAEGPPPAGAAVAKATTTRAPRKPKVDGPKPTPPPRVTLSIDAPTTRGPWTMRVTNEGDVPVHVVADARLLTLEVTPRSARGPVHCDLPADMRPGDDLSRTLVVPAKRSYAEAFEPRLYCFAEGKIDTVAPGAIVAAHLGWTTGSKTEGPFEVSPIDGVGPEVGSLKSLDSAPIALPDEPTARLPPTFGDVQNVEDDVPRLSLQASPTVDAVMPNNIEIPVTLRNEGGSPVIVRFRPEALRFDVVAPGGVEHCAWPTVPAAPLREMFVTLAPHASATLDVTLSSYCTGRGLDRPGLLVVRPQLDTRHASGASLGLRTFDGTLAATVPTLVRLHRGAAPAGPLLRPHLEPPTP
jgi:hypothetical protein